MTRIAALAALLLLAMPRETRAQTEASAASLQRWVTAVRAHVPGEADAAAGFVATLSYNNRVELNMAMQVFFAALRGQAISERTAPRRQINELFSSVRVDPGIAAFLRRAAILHTDAAIFRVRFHAPVGDYPPPSTQSQASSALLFNKRLVLSTDGRVVGSSVAEWNWPFARELLDLLLAVAPDRPFAAEWYHAADSYLLATTNHGDLTSQLQHAAAVLPDEPRILFDRACEAEALGLPLSQAVSGEARYAGRTSLSVSLPSEDKTDAEAERLFRRAIDIDPSYAEARVRLARLLERRGQHDAAAEQLEPALASKPDRVTAYYAQLVAGRVAQARGRFPESREHYAAASTLFPDAQSALLGASQAAAMTGDVETALASVHRLSERSEVYAADPWWTYNLGSGRDVTALMTALWARVAK